MAKVSLPYSMEQDRTNKVKANSVHVDANFNTLLEAVNNKIDKDGSTIVTADLPMSNHKVTGLAQPTNSGDATTKGYVDSLITELRNSIASLTTTVSNNLKNLQELYPVGSVYIGTQNSCPMKKLIPNSTWSLVSKGKALWTGNGTSGSGTTANSNFENAPANTTIVAGVPNITATVSNNIFSTTPTASGAFTVSSLGNTEIRNDGSGEPAGFLNFDASKSNDTYGKSTTVQPPAYVVNVWRRTA